MGPLLPQNGSTYIDQSVESFRGEVVLLMHIDVHYYAPNLPRIWGWAKTWRGCVNMQYSIEHFGMNIVQSFTNIFACKNLVQEKT